MSKQMIGDSKFVVYRGILSEIRLTTEGTVDHLFISFPQKLIVSHFAKLGNLKGGPSQFIDVGEDPDEEDFEGNRLHVEGADISNIFLKRLDDLVIQNGLDYWLGLMLNWSARRWRDLRGRFRWS